MLPLYCGKFQRKGLTQMADEGFDGRAVVVGTYRRIAQQIYTEGHVLLSQSRALSDAADRIEAGAAPAALMLPDGSERDVGLGELREAGERQDELLRAVVDAVMAPPTEMYRATLEEVANEAGWDLDEASRQLGEWERSLIESSRIRIDAGDPRVVFLPLPAAWTRLGLDPPEGE